MSPSLEDQGVWIQQDAWFHLGQFDKDTAASYQLKKEGNGLYVFVLKGRLAVDDQELNTKDGYGIWNINTLAIKATSDAEFLLMEVPMTL